ncbi:MAG: hypothetical protein MSJ26_03770 [Oscillospiraceae bacterium]|nr:hypothetical protein [Oscillospiraceae bacterium]
MKHSLFKIIAPVFIAAGISACGIADISMPPEPKLSGGFTCDCNVSAAIIPPGDESGEETEFAFSGKLSRLGTGFFELELTSPETVSGMKISSRDGDISSSLGELTLDISAEDIPQKSPVYALFNSFDNMAAAFENGGELVPGDDGGWVYRSDGLSAVFDENGYITSMAIASPKMTAEFTNFTASESVPETAISSESSSSAEETSETTTAATAESSEIITSPAIETTAASVILETTATQTTETTAPITTME